MMVRASMPSSEISCDQAATYQVFLRKWFAVLIASPLIERCATAILVNIQMDMAEFRRVTDAG